jgi:hypothetical protein
MPSARTPAAQTAAVARPRAESDTSRPKPSRPFVLKTRREALDWVWAHISPETRPGESRIRIAPDGVGIGPPSMKPEPSRSPVAHDLYELLERLGTGIAALRVIQRSLQQREMAGDEEATLGRTLRDFDQLHIDLDAAAAAWVANARNRLPVSNGLELARESLERAERAFAGRTAIAGRAPREDS